MPTSRTEVDQRAAQVVWLCKGGGDEEQRSCVSCLWERLPVLVALVRSSRPSEKPRVVSSGIRRRGPRFARRRKASAFGARWRERSRASTMVVDARGASEPRTPRASRVAPTDLVIEGHARRYAGLSTCGPTGLQITRRTTGIPTCREARGRVRGGAGIQSPKRQGCRVNK